MPSPGVCLFSKISILILCVDVKISGQPQSSLDNINSGGLFWSSVITSGHWEREIQAATQYNIYIAINKQYQPQPSPNTHIMDWSTSQRYEDIADISTLKAKAWLVSHVYYILYCSYIMYFIYCSLQLNLLGSEDLWSLWNYSLSLALLHLYINQFLLFLISWCLRFHYISFLWSIKATKNYKITNKLQIFLEKERIYQTQLQCDSIPIFC